MSYRHTWVNNETITAAKLNNIEEGIQEAAQSGSGFDAVINIYHASGSGDYDFTIESGSFASVKALLDDNTSPTILVKVFDDYGGVHASALAVSFYYWGTVINLVAKIPTAYWDNNAAVQEWFKPYSMEWASDDTITWW